MYLHLIRQSGMHPFWRDMINYIYIVSTQLSVFREASLSTSQEHLSGCEWVWRGAQLELPEPEKARRRRGGCQHASRSCWLLCLAAAACRTKFDELGTKYCRFYPSLLTLSSLASRFPITAHGD